MSIGTRILAFRKQKTITQETLAAELGITAAAVSKWEKGYTLPDILMLCALADYFDVTTDELLERRTARKQAIIVAQTETLGHKIAELADSYNIQTRMVLTDYNAALAFQKSSEDPIHYMFTAMDHPLEEQEMNDGGDTVHVNVHVTGGTDEDVLNGIELYLRNTDAFKNISDLTATGKR